MIAIENITSIKVKPLRLSLIFIFSSIYQTFYIIQPTKYKNFFSGPIHIYTKGELNMKDLCHCGKLKDERANQCRSCSDLESSQRPCKGCDRTLPMTAYSIRPSYSKKGGSRRRARCKECESKYAKCYRKTNPEIVKERKKRWAIKYPDRDRRGKMRRTWRKMGLDPDYVEQCF